MRVFDRVLRRHNVAINALRSRLWPVPALVVLGAAVLAVALTELDATFDERLPSVIAQYAFSGGPDAAREVLGAIATSLVTVTSLTFSLTLITLQLASSQYSPRLLRTFASDRFIQRTLALFLATFVYALTVLRTVRSDGERGSPFVPQISTTVAFVLAVASVLALVLFLGHLVRQIRIETTLDGVAADTIKAARRILEPRDSDAAPPQVPSPPSEVTLVCAQSSGFLVMVDEDALLDAAVEARATVRVDRSVGSHLTIGVPAASCWPSAAGTTLEADVVEGLRERVAAALRTGKERTAAEDIGYGLRQLCDVIVRALSPGVNDPTTAVHGLNVCGEVLCELTGRRLGARVLRDDEGVTRVVIAAPDLHNLLDLVCTQPMHYGAQDPTVVAALLTMLGDVYWRASSTDDRRAVTEWLQRIYRAIEQAGFDQADRDHLDGVQRRLTTFLLKADQLK